MNTIFWNRDGRIIETDADSLTGEELSNVCEDCLHSDCICDEDEDLEACRKCGEPNTDGEGWNGLCGSCADREDSHA